MGWPYDFTYSGDHSIQFIPVSLLVTDDDHWTYQQHNDGMIVNGQFIGKNSWADWHLIPDGRPLVSMPSVKTEYLEIPALDGKYDLTEVVAGRPIYSTRTGSWSFYVANGFDNWYELYSDIANYLHGRKVRVVLMDDPDYFYEGRVSVNEWSSEESNSKITLDYELQPFKRNAIVSDSNYWDFNTTSKTITLTIPNTSIYRIRPEFDIVPVNTSNFTGTIKIGTSSSPNKFSFDLTNAVGHIKPPSNFKIYEGNNYLTITGAASGPQNSIYLIYRGGKL